MDLPSTQVANPDIGTGVSDNSITIDIPTEQRSGNVDIPVTDPNDETVHF